MRAKKNLIFLVFSLGMVIFLGRVYGFFQNYFSDRNDYVVSNQRLKLELEREKLKTSVANIQLRDLQQDVAQFIPLDQLKLTQKHDYQLRQMSLAARIPASDEGVDLSSLLMEKGKQEFKAGKYPQAIKVFREVKSRYPASSSVIEAHFFLGESLFQANKYEECLDVVFEMMNHFPSSEMTGYLMLRNAQILAHRKRAVESKEIYRIIIKNFKSSEDLKAQAEKLLKITEA